jgi:excisionase family DNA binding protein
METAVRDPKSVEPRYVSLAHASAVAQLSSRTLRRAIARKQLRAHRVGRLIRIDLAELHRWIEADGAARAESPRDGTA